MVTRRVVLYVVGMAYLSHIRGANGSLVALMQPMELDKGRKVP